MARYLFKGDVAKQGGNDHPSTMPVSSYKTRDGHINIAASGDAIWKRLCKVLDKEEWLALPEFASDSLRVKNCKPLNESLNAVLAASTECFGGLLLMAGLMSRLAALPLAFTMIVAALGTGRRTVRRRNVPMNGTLGEKTSRPVSLLTTAPGGSRKANGIYPRRSECVMSDRGKMMGFETLISGRQSMRNAASAERSALFS